MTKEKFIEQLENTRDVLHSSILRHFGAKIIKAYNDKSDKDTLELINSETKVYLDKLDYHINGLFSVFNEMNEEV